MSTLILSEEEIVDLTGKHRWGSQSAVLNSLGIHHKVRPDGRIIVARAHFEQVMLTKETKRRAPVEAEPDWSAAA